MKFLIAISCVLALLMPRAVQAGNGQCTNALEHVLNHYSTTMMGAAELYLEMRAQNFLDEQPGQAVTTKMWKAGELMRMECNYFTLYKDAQHEVMILHDARSIIVRDLSQLATGNNASEAVKIADPIAAMLGQAETVNCSTPGQLEMAYPSTLTTQYGTLQSASIAYEPESGRFLKGEYTFDYEGGTLLMVNEITQVNYQPTAVPFTGTALAQVQHNGQLKAPYADYKFKDLRNSQTK